jgi:sterol 3beta-glucosyltransferase
LAERHAARAMRVLPVPALTPTRAFPLPLLAQRDLGAVLNRASYAPMAAGDRPFAGVLRAWRRELGLPPRADRDRRAESVATLYPVSEAVVARPGDWPATTRLTGYWFLDDPAPLPPDLEAFLESGPPPFVVGFSSLVGRDPGARTRTVLEALTAVGERAVLVAGWGGLDGSALPAGLRGRVHVTAAAPFERLFPRALAVVHHGGAGTTAEALRAGVPSLVVPFFGDQPFWGARVAALGVGPAPIPQARLEPAGLRRALERLRDDAGMRAAAADLGARLRAEDGVAVAVGALEAMGR